MRRIVAANRIVLSDGTTLSPGFVELDGCRVVRTERLCGEQPFTEWLGGTVTVGREADGAMHASKDGRMLSAS